MGGGSDPPQPYGNPQANTQQQTQLNTSAGVESQRASMVGQQTPFGSLDYVQSGVGPNGVPTYTAISSLSPEMQAIVKSLQGGITGQLAQGGFDTSNAAKTIGDATGGLTKDAMEKQVAYLSPFFNQQQEQLDNQLRNQGIFPGTPAYQQGMNNLSQSQNQTVTGFLSTMEPQMYQQATSSYMLPLTLAGQQYSMLNPQGITQSLINPPQANFQPADYMSAVSEYDKMQMEAYKQQVAQNIAMIQGISGIVGKVGGGIASGGLSAGA